MKFIPAMLCSWVEKMKEIDEILRFINSPKADNVRERISEINLPEELNKWVKEYNEACDERNNFLWKWVYGLTTARNPGFMFSIVPEEKSEEIGILKTILTIFIAVIDDVADRHQDKKLLKELVEVPLEGKISNSEKNRNKRLKLAIKLWRHIENKLKELHRFEDFREIFIYDVEQVLNSFHHSYLVNKNPELLNYHESKIYGGHNMVFFLYADIDLMSSPNFDCNDLSELREVVWNAQQMARIGNWLSTWERELEENDFSSGVFAYGIKEKIIDKKALKKGKKEELKKKIRNSNIQENLLEEWQKLYYKIKKKSDEINSINIDDYLEGLKKGLKYHLLSKGYK